MEKFFALKQVMTVKNALLEDTVQSLLALLLKASKSREISRVSMRKYFSTLGAFPQDWGFKRVNYD